MLDWFAAWGVYSVTGFVFREVLAPLAKGTLEDYTKDFLKDCIRDFSGCFEDNTLNTVVGKALKEFLVLVQQELEDAEVSEVEVEEYSPALTKFIHNSSVKGILGSGFQDECSSLDTQGLGNLWYQLNLRSLPEDFDWEQVGKRYLRKVKALIRESPELREILDSQKLEAIARYTQESAGIIPEFDLRRYQEGLREAYGNLRLDSLDTTGCAYNALKLWRIFIAQNVRKVHEVLPQVYELPKEHQRRLRETDQLNPEFQFGELNRYQRVYSDAPIQSVLDVINDKRNYPYLVILGDPGSGKSTLLQYLALMYAQSPLQNAISLAIPILIELRTYMRNRDLGQCQNFLEFLHQSSGAICHLNQHQLQEQLKAGKVLMLFDGLDEVFDPGKREDVITDIHRFTNEYPDVQVIVTSRVIGYKPQRLRNAEFHHFLLQELDEKQIQDFIYRWHELTFTDEVGKGWKRERLQRAIDTSKAIRELAGNPLLLTMMAILNRNQELPRDRPELYHQASRVLLHQWDVERALIEDSRLDPKTIDYKDKQAMLRRVAYFMQATDQGLAGNLIRAEDLERILTESLKNLEVNQARLVARVLIRQLRERNFILCYLGADYYGFVHRTFLEYFCAWEFIWQFKETQRLSLEGLKTEVFGKHWQDESWHEVLRLIVGMIEESRFAGEIIEYLMNQEGEDEKFMNVFLAAQCLEEVKNRQGILETDNKLLERLKGLTEYGYMIFMPYSNRALEFLDLVEEIRTQAITAIATTWKEDPDTLPLLKQLIQFDDDGDVRGAAVEELARGWKDEPDTLPLLKHLIQSDDDWDIRRAAIAAIEELAKGWKDDPDTLSLLKQLIQSDAHENVRGVAIQELAKGWKNDPDTLPLLKQLIQSDAHENVRGAAVQELAKGWKDDLDILPLLKQLIQSDDDGNVRRAAIQELARGWKQDPDTLPLLKQRIQSDDNWDIRRAAIEELAKGWKDYPDTLPLLKQLIQSDAHENVRRAA
ncbi:NACHT domain-containing protein, partial [Coleofasciculus sp. E1-EBD-02]|uniref:NACHT domain-containing protein n=1 Tax=Coleofasciculus sp. E1-EBD-02 TaxID=3068481 RepID=UPI0032F6FAAB